MKLLAENHYYKVTEPLEKVTINTLFAQDIIQQKIKGKIYVDNIDAPNTFYIVHPYGMTLLLGAHNNESFNADFKEYSLNIGNIRNHFEWMQAYPNAWHPVLAELYKDCIIRSSDNKNQLNHGIIELNTRVNFKFNPQKYRDIKTSFPSDDVKIVRTDSVIFRNMKGSVIPHYFWKNEQDFLNNGVGFSLLYQNQPASTAYSACIQGNQLEFGIETAEDFRGKGFAEMVCLALLEYAIKNNFEPVWACKLENKESYNLAQKLGFEPSLEIPFYRLSN